MGQFGAAPIVAEGVLDPGFKFGAVDRAGVKQHQQRLACAVSGCVGHLAAQLLDAFEIGNDVAQIGKHALLEFAVGE